VTWPLLLPVTMVIVLFSVIQTFADFQLVYVLTAAARPTRRNCSRPTAYQIGIGTGLLSQARPSRWRSSDPAVGRDHPAFSTSAG